MKSTFAKLAILIIVIILASCSKKWDKEQTMEEPIETLESKSFNPSFDWNTARNITVKINCERDEIITISSSDNKTRFHRGFHSGENKVYEIKLNIPKTQQSLMLNGTLIELESSIITHAII